MFCEKQTLLDFHNSPSLAFFYRVNAMNPNPNKQIVFRLEDAEHRKLRLKAAEEGLTPNQYAKKFMLGHIEQQEKTMKKS